MTQLEAKLKRFEAQNTYCGCPDLARLFAHEKRANQLVAKCDFMKRNVDLKNIKPEDLDFVRDYQATSEKMDSEILKYHAEIDRLGRQGKLKFVLHDKKLKPRAEVTYEQMIGLIHSEFRYVFAILCSSCNQQIDVFYN